MASVGPSEVWWSKLGRHVGAWALQDSAELGRLFQPGGNISPRQMITEIDQAPVQAAPIHRRGAQPGPQRGLRCPTAACSTSRSGRPGTTFTRRTET